MKLPVLAETARSHAKVKGRTLTAFDRVCEGRHSSYSSWPARQKTWTFNGRMNCISCLQALMSGLHSRCLRTTVAPSFVSVIDAFQCRGQTSKCWRIKDQSKDRALQVCLHYLLGSRFLNNFSAKTMRDEKISEALPPVDGCSPCPQLAAKDENQEHSMPSPSIKDPGPPISRLRYACLSTR